MWLSLMKVYVFSAWVQKESANSFARYRRTLIDDIVEVVHSQHF